MVALLGWVNAFEDLPVGDRALWRINRFTHEVGFCFFNGSHVVCKSVEDADHKERTGFVPLEK